MTKAPGIQILAALTIIRSIRAYFLLITFIIVQNIALGTYSLLLIWILLTRDTLWSTTHITLSGVWIHQQPFNCEASFFYNFKVAFWIHLHNVLANFSHLIGKLAVRGGWHDDTAGVAALGHPAVLLLLLVSALLDLLVVGGPVEGDSALPVSTELALVDGDSLL